MEQTKMPIYVTTIDELKQMSSGEIVELPPFSKGTKFYARLKRPSLLAMAKTGKIPNSLLIRANELFIQDGSGFDIEEEGLMQQMFDVFDLIAQETFVEPKYKDIKEAGIELTDEQYMFLFNYSQKGVNDLESFREE